LKVVNLDNNTQDLLDYMNERSQHVPTVYDCNGCKYNVGLIKNEHCSGCRVPDGSNWIYRQRPTNYEESLVTISTSSSED